jgi:hypothetical protein
MADAPDPLGKRALFWAPAERHEGGPRRPTEKAIPPGRHALFSAAGTVLPKETPKKNGRPRPPLSGTARPRTARLPRPQAARPPRARTPPTKVETAAPAQPKGPISLSCSKCGTHTGVDILKYLVLHLPWWLWRPGRGYTSLMKCPACGQRAWVSASWGPGKD